MGEIMKKQKKKYELVGKIIAGILITTLLFVAVGSAFLWLSLNKIHKVEGCEREKRESTFLDKDILNILLIGEDRRPEEGRTRSDSIIIMTVDKENKTIKLTSLMRDLYVQIPGYSGSKISTAYVRGGIQLLEETIKQNFDIHIDGSIRVDFSDFRSVIDSIGGIELNIGEDQIDVLNTYIKECNKIFGENENSNLVKKSGVQKLNGLQVLAHSRSRYIETGDFGRTERQREILIAVSEQIKKLETWHTLKTAYSILPLLTTDMGNIDLLKLGISICETGVNNIETHNIPVEASFEFDNIEGMDVMVPDLDRCKQALKKIIYGE